MSATVSATGFGGENFVHPGRHFLLHRRDHVGVEVHRDRNLRVPEDSHDQTWVDALREQRRAGARIVESDPAQSRCFQCSMEAMGEGGPLKRCADRCGERPLERRGGIPDLFAY